MAGLLPPPPGLGANNGPLTVTVLSSVGVSLRPNSQQNKTDMPIYYIYLITLP